ncbi:MmyB family transcriptional regulator [Nocardia jiangxiensis]|uniref:MmyB family transcriptional regulator n=1 Tax=Nocardia jiangxiensis TaxID=282685 RepID=UPI0003121176|nr:helix-turn-helix domain-containing protein [Nocardia jiangxiensis]
MKTAEELRPPNVADFVRTRRTRPKPGYPTGFTRQELATRVPSSLSYLNQIENGQRKALTPDFVSALAAALELTATETQHLNNLAALKGPGPHSHKPMAIEQMRSLITDDMRDHMDSLTPHLCGYVDDRWNILAANEIYAHAYPRLLDVTNILVWFFTVSESRVTMLEWEDEARLTVNWFRWHMGNYRNPAWAKDLLAKLSTSTEFREMWLAEEVEFTRHQPLMHLRDPSGEPYSVNVKITNVPGIEVPFQLFVGVKLPFSGPEQLLHGPGTRPEPR